MKFSPPSRAGLSMAEGVLLGYLLYRYSNAKYQQALDRQGRFLLPINACCNDVPLDVDRLVMAMDCLRHRGFVKTRRDKRTGNNWMQLSFSKLAHYL